MELAGKRFCMVSDKEQMLQILHLNNVPSVELVNPKTSTYPIIGRKYGHHGGKDLTIIYSQEQAIDEGCMCQVLLGVPYRTRFDRFSKCTLLGGYRASLAGLVME